MTVKSILVCKYDAVTETKEYLGVASLGFKTKDTFTLATATEDVNLEIRSIIRLVDVDGNLTTKYTSMKCCTPESV
jgi:hypothetical protein